jgi:hypothetical protein
MASVAWWGRKTHYWLAAASALPVAVILATGLLLQLKKVSPWVQPPERRGTVGPPTLLLEKLPALCASVPEAGVRTWDDIKRVDIRPNKGLVKITTASSWEIQLDAADGRVLQSAYRRSDVIESLHDGSFFGEGAKYGLFLPAALALSVLWGTGLYLFILPIAVRARKKRKVR